MIARQHAWQPYYCLGAMGATVQESLVHVGGDDDLIKNIDHQSLEEK